MIHRDWKWLKSDLPSNSDGPTVFGSFMCGGGSSFGAKLAGFNHIGGVEIDPKIARIYKANHKKTSLYVMDIREFLKSGLWRDVGHIDVLEGSPPCTTFSTAGQREKSLGKEKRFKEGQELQQLDDLFFVWLDLLNAMKPSVAVAENVPGILLGTMIGYVKAIEVKAKEYGYSLQIFRINSKNIGVPQSRLRVFFIFTNTGKRITIHPGTMKPILFGTVRSLKGMTSAGLYHGIAKGANIKHSNISSARMDGKAGGFNSMIIHDNSVCKTIISSGGQYRSFDGNTLSNIDLINVSTFPQDYDFLGRSAQFICGMSIPPLMAAWVFDSIKATFFSKCADQDAPNSESGK